jgi:hypothetical protein
MIVYESPLGYPACERPAPADTPPWRDRIWCAVADVRAMTRKWKHAYDRKQQREIERPTCPKCAVLLDELLEKFSDARERGSAEAGAPSSEG